MRKYVLAATAMMAAWCGTNAPAAEVWIGGSRAWGDYTTPGNEDKWTFLRDNADGLYINNFAMRPKESKSPSREDRLAGMHKLLKNKKVFYETDLIHSTDEFDQASIDAFLKHGFAYTAVTINRGTNDARNRILTQDGKLPLYYMFGPWNHEGNITKPKNADLRGHIQKYAGGAVDCPVVVWRGPTGKTGTKPAVYSSVKWCHANGKKFLFLLAPNDSAEKFLPEAQQLVRDMENNDAHPDVWAVAFYGPQSFRDMLEVLPEADAAGKPTKTFSGVPYWLIHHLRDPKKWARLSVPAGERVAVAAGEMKDVAVDLTNRSDWLDLIPVVRLRAGDAAGYTVRATLNGRDVTADLTGDGLTFNRADRLNPGDQRRLMLSITRDSAAPAGPAAITLDLMPHPSERDRVNQSLHLTVDAPAEMAIR